MALDNFVTSGLSVTVTTAALGSRTITDWGESNPPYTASPIDPKRNLRRGRGGGAVVTGQDNPGMTVTLRVNPASDDSQWLKSVHQLGAEVTITATQVSTRETAVGTMGIPVNRGETGRGGTAITDDIFMFEFNLWAESVS